MVRPLRARRQWIQRVEGTWCRRLRQVIKLMPIGNITPKEHEAYKREVLAALHAPCTTRQNQPTQCSPRTVALSLTSLAGAARVASLPPHTSQRLTRLTRARSKVALLSGMDHPGIVPFIESFLDPPKRHFCIVMAFCEVRAAVAARLATLTSTEQPRRAATSPATLKRTRSRPARRAASPCPRTWSSL